MRGLWVAVVAVGVVAGGTAWQLKNTVAEPALTDTPTQQAEPAVPAELATEAQTALPMIEIIGERHVPAPQAMLEAQNQDPARVPVPSEAVVTALRDSMENGDPRTPPLARSEDLREMPSANELADPDLYQQYEQRQNQKVYASFASAATQKISDLERMIARAEAEGLPPEQIQEGREKLEGLRNQRDEIFQAHPEVADTLQSVSVSTGQE